MKLSQVAVWLCLAARVAAVDGEDKDENVTLAIILSLAAGLATAVGGATPFFPHFKKMAQPKVLSASLAVASGVMLYVSFVEIFVKANDSITLGLGNGSPKLVSKEGEPIQTEEVGFMYPGDKWANLVTTLSFFLGCVIVVVLHRLVHALAPETEDLEDHDCVHRHDDEMRQAPPSDAEQPEQQDAEAHEPVAASEDNTPNPPPGHGGGATVQRRPPRSAFAEGDKELGEKERRDLNKMGLLTAVALSLHNFPEGFATFIATLEEPSLGLGLALAIAIHNIPEGICVSMPVYYATGNKWKGFGWALVSGLAEPVGGILGWLALRSVFTDLVFGIAFGVVGGMMVWIVLGELLPTAFQHDPTGKIVGPGIFFGMVVISASLLAFSFA
ncbi:Zinc transporter ZupT [Diplonema papillatum]|nr:Zinc transporter ZupT [Diplonema papillatum]